MPGLRRPRGLPGDVRLRLCQQGPGRPDREQLCGIVLQRLQCRQLRRLRPLTMDAVTIGTRGSKLALWQAHWAREQLEKQHAGLQVRLEIIKTRGDKILDVPLAKVGGKGLFVKEIEQALLEKRVDVAVHSMKDMPAEIPHGLTIAAVPERENWHDVLLSAGGQKLAALPTGARVGTSSLRRAAQLLRRRPDIQIVPLRGNLDTRIKKLKSGQMDAIILAAAGIKRLGFEADISETLDEALMLPAAGQGALCIEARADDPAVAALLAPLEDTATRTAVLGERAFLKRLQGGCQVPIAALGMLTAGQYALRGLVASPDGTQCVAASLSGPAQDCEKIGVALAENLLSRGADRILENVMADEING